jgi:DNA-nicking Smr family endonuclease
VKARSLDQLAALRERLRRAQAEAAEAEATRAGEVLRLARERDEFSAGVGPVRRLRAAGKAAIHRERPAPHPRQRELDEQRAMQEALSDEVDVESLLLTDDGLSFRRPGIGADVLTRLRRGDWALQAQFDLHGMTRDEAREQLAAFLREAHRRGVRCVRVVHGKGHGSPGRQPVLKAKVQRWLAQRTEVIAFAQAPGPQGGAGALLVLLAPSKAR